MILLNRVDLNLDQSVFSPLLKVWGAAPVIFAEDSLLGGSQGTCANLEGNLILMRAAVSVKVITLILYI